LGQLFEGFLHYQSVILPEEKRVEEDFPAACRAYEIAANGGDADATWCLAFCLERISPVDTPAVTAAYIRAMSLAPERIRRTLRIMFCNPWRTMAGLECFVRAAAKTGHAGPVATELRWLVEVANADSAKDAACLLELLADILAHESSVGDRREPERELGPARPIYEH